jgi:hypothetical protein
LCSKENTQNQGQNDNNKHHNTQAPPLELPRITSTLYTLCKLHIGVLGILDDVVGLFFGGLDGGFLDDYCFGEILEELV